MTRSQYVTTQGITRRVIVERTPLVQLEEKMVLRRARPKWKRVRDWAMLIAIFSMIGFIGFAAIHAAVLEWGS